MVLSRHCILHLSIHFLSPPSRMQTPWEQGLHLLWSLLHLHITRAWHIGTLEAFDKHLWNKWIHWKYINILTYTKWLLSLFMCQNLWEKLWSSTRLQSPWSWDFVGLVQFCIRSTYNKCHVLKHDLLIQCLNKGTFYRLGYWGIERWHDFPLYV